LNFSRFVIVVGILFTIFGLVYTFQGVDFGRVVSAVQGLQGRPFWISQAFFLSSLLLRAIRWRYLLLNLKRLPFMPVFAATVIGMFVNNVLPARIGELARAAFLGRREHVSTTSIFANVVVERIVDLFSLLVFLCVYLLFSGGKSENDALLENTGWVLLGGSVCLAAGLFLLTRFESHVKGFTAALVRPWSVSVYERLERGIRSFACGLDVFQSWTQVIVIISLSLGIWLSGVASFFYLLESFSIPLHFLQVLLVFCIVVIGISRMYFCFQ